MKAPAPARRDAHTDAHDASRVVLAPFTASFTRDRRAEAEALARQGYSVREICRRVGTHHHNVRPLVAQLDAAGVLPATCPCGAPRGPAHGSNHCSVSTNAPRRYPKVRESTVPKAKLDEIYRRLKAGESGRKIAREVGVTAVTVAFHKRRWVTRRDGELAPCKCGRPARHPGGCIVNSPSLLSPTKVKQIEEWVVKGLSAAEMLRRSRKAASIHTILKYATPLWEQMAADGSFCGCGDRRGHRGVCIATWDSEGRIRGPQPIPRDEQRRILNALLNGDSIVSVRRAVAVSERKVFRILRAMSPEERHGRAVLVYRRIRDDDGVQHGADLFGKVQAIVPKTLEASIRDEVVSELCLAVLQGDLTLDQIRHHSKTYVGRAFRTWASGFGPRSLDEALGDDGGRTLGDLFGDATGESLIDDIEIGGW